MRQFVLQDTDRPARNSSLPDPLHRRRRERWRRGRAARPAIMPGAGGGLSQSRADPHRHRRQDRRRPLLPYIGRRRGHYVKMVHNGIEYGIMELLSEVYDLLKSVLGSPREMQKIFAAWNQTELNSSWSRSPPPCSAHRPGDRPADRRYHRR